MASLYTLKHPREQPRIAAPPFREWILSNGSAWALFFRLSKGYLIRFPKLADFEISYDGLVMQCTPAPSVDPPTIEHLYLNQVMPLALSMQGELIFHASAVKVHDHAIALIGPSGSGKSTLATSFARHGHPFLTDDCLRAELLDARCLAHPGHPSLRLWKDSRSQLLEDGSSLAEPVQYTLKARILASDGIAFWNHPTPLRFIFFLGHDSESITFRPMTAAESLIELTRHAFLLDTQDRETVASHFDRLSRLTRLPACCHLDFPRRFDTLHEVRAAILEHCGLADRE